MTLENEEGLPWTAATGLGWIILIVVLTSGTALVALGIYLSFWIRSKGRSLLPLYCFCFTLVCGGANLGITYALAPKVGHVLASAAGIAWLVGSFSLRHEIRQHYKVTERWEPQIARIFTLLFSVVYINYCLNRFDLSFPGLGPFNHETERIVSLNLPNPPAAPNLRK